MKHPEHKPLLTDEEILGLLTPEAAQVPRIAEQERTIVKPLAAISGALLVAATAVVLYQQTPVPQVVPIAQETKHNETNAAQTQETQPPELLAASDVNRVSTSKPFVTAMRASVADLRSLGVYANESKVWFIEDGQRVTISGSGVSLRPTGEEASQRTPVAVTVHDASGSYASWYDRGQGTLDMNNLVPVSVPLAGATSSLHQDVIVYLWFAPERIQTIDTAVADYIEQREQAQGVIVQTVYPNPVSGGEATLRITSEEPTRASIRIVDISGQTLLVVAENQQLAAGENTVLLRELQRLPSGMVLVIIELPQRGSTLVQRLLIHR